MVKLSWWKYLGIALVLYSLIGGMLVPLGPGITGSEPLQSTTGKSTTLKVQTYNFSTLKKLNAWLRIDSFLLKANNISTITDGKSSNLTIDFIIPDHFPSKDTQVATSLIIQHAKNGAAVLPSALFLKQKKVNYNKGIKSWERDTVLEGINLVGGLHFPYRNILIESIRNTYYHVPMWFTMIAMFTMSLIFSLRVLKGNQLKYDLWVVNLNKVGVLFGIMGLLTGAIWATYTWGEPWSGDIKQNMSAICLLIYAAYFILRATIEDRDKKQRISAAYNIFAYIAMIPLLFVIPRMTDSLHPGNGGNPAMGGQDLDNTMRMIFYPAVIGWILIGLWLSELGKRYASLRINLLRKIKNIELY